MKPDLRDFAFLPSFAETQLKIKPKTGDLIPLIFNRAQRYLHEVCERQIKKMGRVRICLLKGRQQGGSTCIAARYYHRATTEANTKVFILAHQAAATNSLFDMVQLFYHSSTYPHMRPGLLKYNRKGLSFDEPVKGSSYELATAGTPDIGRSKTIQLLHWSEVAFSENSSAHAAGVLSAVPNEEGTEIILESTANGQNNYFHKACLLSMAGKGGFEFVFFPWYWQDEYTECLDSNFEATQEEAGWLAAYGKDGLTKEHLQWRRTIIDSTFQGNEQRFKKEYPFYPEEAFESSGESVLFSPASVRAAINHPAVETDGNAPLVFGVDPAREGENRTVVMLRAGRNLVNCIQYPPGNFNELCTRLSMDINTHKPQRVFIDVTGFGIGFFDIMVARGFGRLLAKVDFSSSAMNKDQYHNKRAEIYDTARQWFKDKPCAIRLCEAHATSLASELAAITYKFSSVQGRLQIEDKAKITSRLGGVSPDFADAFVCTFAEPTPAAYFNQPIQHMRMQEYDAFNLDNQTGDDVFGLH